MNYYKILDNQEACLKINKATYLNPKLGSFIIENFNSISEINENISQIKNNFNVNIDSFLDKLNSCIEKEKYFIQKNNINIITLNSKKYPKYLKEITLAPIILYTKGNLECIQQPLLSVVGTRNPSEYAKIVTTNICTNLAQYFCLVSGLALGIDSIAHKSCINENKQTIAVLAHGIDSVYPISNKNLAKEIINKNGLLISEFPLFITPQKYHFPQRNRIISGLSQGLFLAEASLKSGSMITASFAVEQNRDIFALPGNITNKNAEGPISLIQQGAKCIYTVNDIFNEFNLEFEINKEKQTEKSNTSSKDFNQIENKILSHLENQLHIDDLQEKTQLDLNTLLHNLTFLEIKSAIKKVSANSYIKL